MSPTIVLRADGKPLFAVGSPGLLPSIYRQM